MGYQPQTLSPLPIVDLMAIDLPSDGWAVKRNNYCSKKFNHSDTCKKFYESVAQNPVKEGISKCPYGFSCYRFELTGRPFAMTCFVPFPRQGGEDERSRAKSHPETKVGVAEVVHFAKALHRAEQSRLDSVLDNMKSYPSALHEIRKYNRTIKQEAERLCLEQSSDDPDKADARLVSIFKCSELMTQQFEVLELIANQSLVDLPINCPSQIYKIFDKCLRIYQFTADKKSVTLRIEGDSPRAMVNDKTFHIVATVLLENAIKYSVPDSEVLIRIQQLPKARCKVSVNNITKHMDVIPHFFEKGARGSHDGTGMGYGLFLAQLVARQHGAEIHFERVPYRNNLDNYIFYFELATIASAGTK